MNTTVESLVKKVGGDRNATIIVAASGAGIVWIIGRRKHAKNQAAATTPTVAQGYADTSMDPTQLYTGYDQLQQEIDSLRTAGNPGSGVTNPNPVPIPTSPGSPPPVAPIPPPPDAPPPIEVQVAQHNAGGPAPQRYAPTPEQQLGPKIWWGSSGATYNGGSGGSSDGGGGWSDGSDGPVGPRRRF